jgi:hypothetical protein
MEDTDSRSLDELVEQLDRMMALTGRLGLVDARFLLSSARLDLQMRRHGIAASELDALCDLLRSAKPPYPRSGVAIKPARGTRRHRTRQGTRR